MRESIKEAYEEGMKVGRDEPDYEFKANDRVEKYTGDYALAGVVVACFKTLKGDVRYVVEHRPLAPGMLHIYSGKNIRHNKKPAEAG